MLFPFLSLPSMLADYQTGLFTTDQQKEETPINGEIATPPLPTAVVTPDDSLKQPQSSTSSETTPKVDPTDSGTKLAKEVQAEGKAAVAMCSCTVFACKLQATIHACHLTKE